MAKSLGQRIHSATGSAVVSQRPLSGGCVGDVSRATLADGRYVVVKAGGPKLDVEGWMLRYLAERSSLPVPAVFHAEPDLLVMEFLPGETGAARPAEPHAADLLADLHSITAQAFGLERDTLIGPLDQPNSQGGSWIDFFRDQRLLHMTRVCVLTGRADEWLLRRAERLADMLPDLIDEPAAPSLLHGDLWGGNILTSGSRVTGLIDPAVSYGHPEIELAFTTLFSTFSPAFYEAYSDRRPIRDGFFEERRDLYNLYPLLVHVRLFGGSYLSQVERTLSRFGV